MCFKNQLSNKAKSLLLSLIAILLCFASISVAGDISSQLTVPEEGQKQMLSLDDGSTMIGRIKEVGESSIIFVTEHGEMTIEKAKIKEVTLISETDIREGQYWFPNSNQTRLYFGPTGRMLKKGDGYFSDIYLFFPSVAYGITDNISIAAGISIFPTDDIGEQIIYVNPKIGYQTSENLSIAASAFLMRVPDWFGDDDIDNDGIDDIVDVVGILFATATYGTPDKSFTFGLGFGYADDEVSENPAVQFGGEYRLSRRMSFVSENWVFPEVDDPMISYGFRFFGESLSVDLALFNTLGDDFFFPGVPYIDFVYNF